MIVWINGAFGAGKRSAARELVGLIPGSTLLDPAVTYEAMQRMLPPERPTGSSDPRELPLWRRLLADGAAALHAEVGGVLVLPLAVLRQEDRDEFFGALAARRIPVRHVLLDPDETILRSRALAAEEEGPARRGDGPKLVRAALESWLAEDAFVLDNGELDARGTALRIAAAVDSGEAGVSAVVQTPPPAGATVASGVLLFDDAGRLMLVDPTYKPGWEFPGGVVEAGESPALAGIREVAEETGIELDGLPRLLVADWERPVPPGHGGLRLLFDGGTLPPGRTVRLPEGELRDWRFVTEEEAAHLLPPVRGTRLHWALRARERSQVLYLEDGVPLGG